MRVPSAFLLKLHWRTHAHIDGDNFSISSKDHEISLKPTHEIDGRATFFRPHFELRTNGQWLKSRPTSIYKTITCLKCLYNKLNGATFELQLFLLLVVLYEDMQK